MTTQVTQQTQIARKTTAWPNTPVPNNGLPKIAIAIPFNGNWIPEWVERMYMPIMYHPLDWCQKVAFLTRVPSISVARNTLVEQALAINADYLFFLDSDIVMEQPSDPNVALSQLYQIMNKSTNKDDKDYKSGRIISGLYRSKQKTGFGYAMWMKYQDKGFMPLAKWQGNYLPVDVVGAGFVLIDMKIFKEVPPPWFVWNDPKGISEDFYFCLLAKKYGYDTKVFSDVKLSHLGTLKVKTDATITVPDV